jgi:signal transduction histidine kinase
VSPILAGHNRVVTLRTRARLAWSLLAVDILLAAAALVASVLARDSPGQTGNPYELFGWVVAFMTFPVVGALIASRGAGGAIGWICLAIGLGVAATALSEQYAVYALVTNPGLPAGAFAAYMGSWSWVMFIGPIGVFFVLLFPDGKLPTRRWRWLVVASSASMASAIVAIALAPESVDTPITTENPLGIEAAAPLLGPLAFVGMIGLFLSIVAALVAAVLRFRRSRSEERQQLKWFATATVITVAAFFSSLPAALVSSTLQGVLQTAGVLAWATLPLAAGIAILRYGLYDIDLVINKAVVFGALATFITTVYLAIVVGVSALVGTAGNANLGLSIAATAVVAVAFQPARVRAQRLANRLVYGNRATPYEVLAEFSEQVARSYAAEEILPRMARTVAEATGARTSAVWLRSGSQLRLAASWPGQPDAQPEVLSLLNGHLPSFPAADRAVEVRHQDELLGALAIVKPPGEALAPAEEKLLNDVASQAGLVLRNARLTSELLARLDELQASRQRLVTAQDEERRRLERNLHDGAQQHLVALKVNLSLAARQAEPDSPLAQLLGSLHGEADEAIEALRQLAHGIYPPLLADQGLAAALEAQTRKSPLAVEIREDGITRYSQDVEAAVYFCALEALQNVAKYAEATRVMVELAEDAGALRFSVTDDGRGFDPAVAGRGAGAQNMADRIEALGGTLEIASAPGKGTTVQASVPLDGARHLRVPA